MTEFTNVTDGQTDRHRMTAGRACIASRGNKYSQKLLWTYTIHPVSSYFTVLYIFLFYYLLIISLS